MESRPGARPLIAPSLWFDEGAEEAARFYVSVFPNSRIVADNPFVVEWELDGQRFIGIKGGPAHAGFTETISFAIDCADQAEVDYYWEKLSDGGEEGPCGWLKDRFGLSWQVVPRGLPELLSDPDPERARRASDAMLAMRKLDIAAIRAAADATS